MPRSCANCSASQIFGTIFSASSGASLPVLKQLPQRDAVHIFHQQVVKAIRLAEIVHGDDVRMAQSSQGLGFAQEALGETRVGPFVRSEDLQRHQAVELRLARLVNDTHAAAAQAFEDFQLREVLGDLGRSEGRLEHFCAVQAEVAGVGGGGEAHAHYAARAKALRRARGQRQATLGAGSSGCWRIRGSQAAPAVLAGASAFAGSAATR